MKKSSVRPQMQQQPSYVSHRQQQQSNGTGEFQPRGKVGPQQQQAGEGNKQMGEGSYEGTADYNKRTADYLKKGTVEADAKAAKPGSEAEAQDLKKAEEEGKSHSKGEGK